jgi:hypothetical protein
LKKTQPVIDEERTISSVFASKPKGGSLLLPPPKTGLSLLVSPGAKHHSKLTSNDDDSWASTDPFQTFSTNSSMSSDPFVSNNSNK